jgi:predicted phage tail protein
MLRLIRRRVTAVVVGAALVVPAVWVEVRGADAWWADGLSLVLGATGVALLWTGLFGLRPDWVE